MPSRGTIRNIRGGGADSTSRRGLSSSAGSVFDSAPFWKSSGIILGANALGFAINLACPTCHYHVDLLGTGAFAAAALPTLLSSPIQRIQWSSAAVTAWSVKLAGFLFYRVLQTKHDARLDAQLADPTSAAGFWFVSALWGLVCSLPHTLGTTSSAKGSTVLLKVGAGLFGAGWLTETLADYQKWIFKANHPGQFCNVGLWSIVQHPNWLGNLMLWTGILIMNAPALIEPSVVTKTTTTTAASVWRQIWRGRRLALALAGPAFMWILFDAQATGKILSDSLQATHEKYGYGTDASYTHYIDHTPLILPNPFQGWFSGRSSSS